MATDDNSPNEIEKHLIEANQKNFYEIAWALRKQVAMDYIKKNPSAALPDILVALEDFENRYLCRLEKIKSVEGSAIGEKFFFTGKIDIEAMAFEPSSPAREEEALASRSLAHAAEVMRLLDAGGFGPFDTVAELGAGYGANLFRLSQDWPGECRFVAAEITDAGRDFCDFLSGLEGVGALETVAFDHRRPDFSFVDGSDSILLITCHSIEQVSELPPTFFPALSAAAPKVVGIHLEPFGFQFDTSTERAKRHQEFVIRQEFNLNFHARLIEAEETGHINVRHLEVDRMAHQSENPTSVAVWDNFSAA